MNELEQLSQRAQGDLTHGGRPHIAQAAHSYLGYGLGDNDEPEADDLLHAGRRINIHETNASTTRADARGRTQAARHDRDASSPLSTPRVTTGTFVSCRRHESRSATIRGLPRRSRYRRRTTHRPTPLHSQPPPTPLQPPSTPLYSQPPSTPLQPSSTPHQPPPTPLHSQPPSTLLQPPPAPLQPSSPPFQPTPTPLHPQLPPTPLQPPSTQPQSLSTPLNSQPPPTSFQPSSTPLQSLPTPLHS